MTTRSNSRRNMVLWDKQSTPTGEVKFVKYKFGNMLGKGGFAHVYELIKEATNESFAVKVVSKRDRDGKSITEKIKTQIELMQIASKNCENVVKMFNIIDDEKEAYIIMENCWLGDLNTMFKKRKFFTEPEVRFFIVQMTNMLISLKKANIIHRDIKLANIFVSKDFQLKLGDFGLSTFNTFEYILKKNVCGTPNYLAPEVIEKAGYDFQVDLWAVGVCVFIMLMGKAPFETKSCAETYERIKKGEFKFINNIYISSEAKAFISEILVKDPRKRIKLNKIKDHPFLKDYPIPDYLEEQCRQVPPSKDFLTKYSRRIKRQTSASKEKTTINISETRLDRVQESMIKDKQMEVQVNEELKRQYNEKIRQQLKSEPKQQTKESQQKDKQSVRRKSKDGSLYRNVRKSSLGLRLDDHFCSRVKPRELAQIYNKVVEVIKTEPTYNQIPTKQEYTQEDEIKVQEIFQEDSKCDTSVSLKRRPQIDQIHIYPKKRYRPNIPVIEEKQEQKQLIDTIPKIKIVKKTIIPEDAFSDQDSCEYFNNVFKKDFNQKSDFVKNYQASHPPKPFDIKADFRDKKKIVWYEITHKNGLMYHLNNNKLGAIFKDGTILIQSSPLKIKRVDQQQQNCSVTLKQDSLSLDKLTALKNTMNNLKTNPNINIQSPEDIVYVDSYAIARKIHIFHFSNNDIQFIFEDEGSLMIHKGQYVSYQHKDILELFSLPANLDIIINPQAKKRYQEAVDVYTTVKIGSAWPYIPHHLSTCQQGGLNRGVQKGFRCEFVDLDCFKVVRNLLA